MTRVASCGLMPASWAVSSAVEHCLHTAGVTGSIPVPPTKIEALATCVPGLFAFRRWLALAFCLTALPAQAVSSIEIHIGEIRHPAAQIENLSAAMKSDGRWQGKAVLKQAGLAQLSKDITLPIALSKGVAEGRAEFSGNGMALDQIKADIDLRDAAFGDESGLHAGEKIGGTVHVVAHRSNQATAPYWQWQIGLDWREGEMFWQPLYLTAGHALKAQGSWQPDQLRVDRGELKLDGIGSIALQGNMHLPEKNIDTLSISASNLQAGNGYEVLAKPFFEKSMLGNLNVGGRLDVEARIQDGKLDSFRLNLADMDIEDKNGRFALYKLNAGIPWAADTATRAVVKIGGGRALNLTLGEANLSAKLDGWSLSAQEWNIPILDGVVSLQDVSAALRDGQWHGHFAARLAPISMGEFSHAMGWPRMEGKLEGSIPLITYSSGTLAMDGAMQVDVFDGRVSVSKLTLDEALGLAPRLKADIEMRNLDLDLLTRTFSFGAMKGRLDGDVTGMELSSWKPVKFDARFRSSPGNYPRKISQRAVENISALGGAGAAAAIQRSFLRFLNEFNYAKIGLSCKLRNGICAMDGVEPTASGYVIVKGSGIPAITVLGYNRNVSWNELLERVQRITAGNAKPVIK